MDFLNDLNVAFDEIITRFDVYKVGVRHFRAFILSRFHPESCFRKIMMTHVSFSLVLDHLLTFFSCEKPLFSFFHAVDLQTDACKDYISFLHRKAVETLAHNSLTNHFLGSTIRYLKLKGNLIRIQSLHRMICFLQSR